MSDLPETALCVHFYLDHQDLDPTVDLNNGAKFVRDIRCRWTNVTAASKFDLGMDFIRRLRHENPRLKIIWRAWNSKYGLDDDVDMWQNLSAQEWYNRRVTPFLDFIRETGCYVMTINESYAPPISRAAEWQAKVMEIGHLDGVQFAVDRTSTGNPAENDYPLLKPLFVALDKYSGVYSPNEYTNEDPAAAAGNIERYHIPLDMCRTVWKVSEPEVCVGEFGTAKATRLPNGNFHIDPEGGYQTMGMGGRRYCKLLVDGTRQFYIPRKASALVFCWGPWKKAGFNIARDEELQEAWKAEVRAGNLDLPERLPVEIITPPPVVTPPPAAPKYGDGSTVYYTGSHPRIPVHTEGVVIGRHIKAVGYTYDVIFRTSPPERLNDCPEGDLVATKPEQPTVSPDALTMLRTLAADVQVTTARWQVELATIQAKLHG